MKVKKIISLILVVMMVMQFLPVFADETTSGEDNYGYVINDTFDDGTVCGWAKGVGYNAVTLTPDAEEGVLKVVLPGANAENTWAATEQQSMITKTPESPIAFTGENLVRIKARVKAENGDSYFIKVNRPDKMGWNQIPLTVYNNHMYTVAGLYNGKPVYGGQINGIFKNTPAATLLADGSTFDYTDVSLANKWVDYTITINGATNEQWVEASFEHNGETVTVLSGETSSFVQPQDAYTSAGATGTNFAAFERLTFTSRTTAEQTIYIDNVSVENIKITDVTPELVSDKVIDKTESVKIKLTSEDDILTVPSGAITIEGVCSTESYDAETKVLTLVPSELNENTTYNVLVNSPKFASYGIRIAEETNFSFTTTGYAINDTFDDGTVSGWAKGVGYKAVTLTPDAEEGVLKVVLPGANEVNTWAATEQQSMITKTPESPIAFTGENLVRIKARVKAENGDSYFIKVNRPDKMGWNQIPLTVYNNHMYTVAGLYNGKPVYGGQINGIFKNTPAATLLADGSTFDYTDVSLANKWVDYTITINGATNEQWVEASFEHNGETVTVLSGETSSFVQPQDAYTSAGATGTNFAAFERLTFTSRTTAEQTIYIDNVSVENIKITDVTPELVSDKVIDKTESVKIKLTSEDDILTVPSGAITIEGVRSTESYDAETKVLTLVPSELNENTTYNVLVNSPKFASYGIRIAEETSFSFTTTGYAINDTFDDGTVSGWAKGVGYKAVTLTPDAEEGVLKVVLPGANEGNTWAATEQQSMITKVPESTIAFTGENLVRIKARVKAENGDAYFIKVNRPDKMGWNQIPLTVYNNHMYTVAGLFNGKPVYGGQINGIFKNTPAATLLADGSTFDYTDVSLANKWVDYTITINGATNEQWVEASFEHNGKTVTVLSGEASSFVQPQDAYTSAGATGTVFEAFERLTFTSRTTSEQTIYIDSVSVESIKITDVYGQILANSVEKDGEIKVQFLTNVKIPSMPEGAVNIDGVKTSSSYDANTKTVTLSPDADLEEGATYTVSVNKNVLIALGLNYAGTTNFKVRCRGKYSTGVVINDTFDAEGDVGAWKAGVTNGNTVTAEQTTFDNKGVLMFTADGTFNQNLHGKDGNIITNVGNGIEFKEGQKIVIETSVYKTGADSTFDLKFNRPNEVAQVEKERVWATYGIFRQEGSAGVDYITGHLPADSETPYWSVQEKVPGTEEITTIGKWVDYKITLDGTNRTYDMEVKIDGETYKMSDGAFSVPKHALEKVFGKNTTKVGFDSLDTLTFKISHKDTIYIDYIKVYENGGAETGASFLIDGEKAETFKIGNVVKPSFTLNPAGQETTYTLISAIYIGGILDDIHVDYVTTDKIMTYTETDGYKISAEDAKDTVIKAFIWAGSNGLETLSPVSNSADIKPDASILDASLTVYVQAYSGSDTIGTGEEASPVASLKKALEIVKTEKRNGYAGAATILLGEGNYELSETIVVRNENVPSGGLVISSRKGEKAVLNAGVSYNFSDAVKVEQDEIISRLNSEEAKQNLYVLDLTTKLALSDISAVDYPGTYNLNSMLSTTDIETPSNQATFISFDNELMDVSRYPDSGYATMGEVIDSGIEARFLGEEYDGTTNDLDVTQENLLKGFEFKFDYKNLASWANADQALIFGYFYHNWATQTVPLKEVDTINGTIRTKYPSYFGAKSGGRFYVYNLLEEIDKEGEYFLDRENGLLYFYKPSNAKENSTITIANKYVNLLTVSGASNVTIDSLDFTMTKGCAISLRGSGNNVVISNCDISNTASMAIDVVATNSTVKNCYIHDVNGGVTLNSPNNDTAVKTMTVSNNKVLNNEIENFSIVNKTYTPAITLYGAGNQALNNEIHKSEHMAIRYGGYGHLIKGNEIYDVCKEVDDSGAIYVGNTWTNRGTEIINNYFHDIKSTIDSLNTVSAIFLDDHFAGAYVEGNIFANIAGDGIRGNGGREHMISNNIFVNCLHRGTYMPDNNYTEETAATTYASHISNASNYIGNKLWETSYPLMFTSDESENTVINVMEMKNPGHHIFTNNLLVKAPYYYGERATLLADDISGNYETNSDPGFFDMANGNFAIDGSVIKALIPEFKTIDFSNIGRY